MMGQRILDAFLWVLLVAMSGTSLAMAYAGAVAVFG